MYKIYYIFFNTDMKNRLVWMVDGEIGFKLYPGHWTEEYVRYYYENGLTIDEKEL